MSPRSRNVGPVVAAQLTLDAEPYLSCDDCFEHVDACVETLLSRSTGSLTQEFRAHLIGCAACRAEARSLTELAAEDLGVDRQTALARFDAALAARSSRS